MKDSLIALDEIKKNYHFKYADTIIDNFIVIENQIKAFKILIKQLHIKLCKFNNAYFIRVKGNCFFISKEKYNFLYEVFYETSRQNKN